MIIRPSLITSGSTILNLLTQSLCLSRSCQFRACSVSLLTCLPAVCSHCQPHSTELSAQSLYLQKERHTNYSLACSLWIPACLTRNPYVLQFQELTSNSDEFNHKSCLKPFTSSQFIQYSYSINAVKLLSVFESVF